MEPLPGLSAALEAKRRGASHVHVASIDEQVISRRIALRDALARASSTGSTTSSGGAAASAAGRISSQILDWPTFAGPYTGGGEVHVRTARANYNKFVSLIQAEVFDGAASPEEVKAAAHTVYCAVLRAQEETHGDAGDKSATAVRRILSSGGVAPGITLVSVKQLQAAVGELHAWRTAHRVTPEIYSSATTTTGAAGAAAAAMPAAGALRIARSTSAASVSGGLDIVLPAGFVPLASAFQPAPSSAAAAPAAAAAVAAVPPPWEPFLGTGNFFSPLEQVLRDLAAVAASAAAAAAAKAPATGAAAPAAAAAASAASAAPRPAAPATGAAPSGPIDSVWLYAACAQHIALTSAGSGGASGGAFTPDTLGTALLASFQRYKGGTAEEEARLQMSLFELLGEGGLDLMGKLFDNRRAVIAISQQEFRRVCAALAAQKDAAALAATRVGALAPSSTAGRTVMVTSTADIAAEKERRRVERRLQRQTKALASIQDRLAGEFLSAPAGSVTAADALVAAGFDPSIIAVESSLGLSHGGGGAAGGAGTGGASRPGKALLSVDEVIASVGAGFGGSIKKLLPAGTVETTHEGYKQVVVPPPSLVGSAARTAPHLVPITDLDHHSQKAFKGIARLNRLQSELFESAYRSGENLLVCAPTGAGKTNVAMLTICQQIASNLTPDGRVDVDALKIIYVAPMKALAQEVVDKFGQRLSPLGISVRELTGDMQLTRKEIAETQVIVTTPEKWDVITRKGGDGSLVSQVKLLIIDEVHLLADDRGAVIESIVARTLRLVESSQSAIRIVGLSATLPNYQDVALFLRVNPSSGLFYFNDAYRPVPLLQTFIGVTENNALRRVNQMNKVAYEKAMAAIRKGKQVMVFVHSRKDTAKTARALLEFARADNVLGMLSPFSPDEVEGVDAIPTLAAAAAAATAHRVPPGAAAASAAASATGATTSAIKGEGRIALTERQWMTMQQEVDKSRNADLKELFPNGFGIHHAGMLRADRGLTERMFAAGVVKILVCTATLAWGVNLPAHTVIIKGTQIYDAEAGGFNDLGMLDVMQIFGRAGRPQFDTSGEGIIITGHDKLQHYLQMLTHSVPIESSFIKALPDHLNAEIVSGTVTNMREALSWLSYTYLFIRMLRNPVAYGVPWDDVADDPMLEAKRVQLITQAAQRLDFCHMIRFDERSGNFAMTDLGRVASHYYIHNGSIETFNTIMDKGAAAAAATGAGAPMLTDVEALDLICAAEEFKNIKVRDEELQELDFLKARCKHRIKGDVANTTGKVNVLLQAHIGQLELRGFTLISDKSYINQSAGRIARALFEIFLRKGWCTLAAQMLAISKSIDKQIWWDQSPLWQLTNLAAGSSGGGMLTFEIVRKLDDSGISVDALCDMGPEELGSLVRHPNMGPRVYSALHALPYLHIETTVAPVTRSILRLTLTITPEFEWVDRLHGAVAEPWYIWVEDGANEHMYHHEYLLVPRRTVRARESLKLEFAIPIFEPLPPQYWVRAISDRWLGLEVMVPISFKHLVLPERHPPHTDLLDLTPLPVTALKNEAYQSFYASSFSHFNPVQTQIFHALYHGDGNVLLGAPTGSGKTVAAELAVFRLFNAHPGAKAVYIAPLKALVSERMKDWKRKFADKLGKRVEELTGDYTPDMMALQAADILITTPEKWDSISRSWKKRGYVQRVGLVIIDEIHLLGEDRGPVLEVIVSRMRYVAAHTERHIRFVGLSTALANARDLGDWLGIDKVGLYNFRPSVRPVPMEVHVQGFPGKHYCPRMATMNKPAYAAITTYSPDQPALIFVSSRRQTRLTALELIALCATDEENPKRFLHMPPEELDALATARVKDASLRDTLAFGIGIHHAGLAESDRTLVEELYLSGRIQVLVCTSTLAWGVNFPAHLVIVKGTEFFDSKIGGYRDFPVTDVLQMMGRAGRPQFDTHAVAVILVHEPKKNFFRKFLYEPFPVESKLKGQLTNHINAEIAAGTITSRHDAVDWLTWTYLFRRLLQNPSFYGLEDTSKEGVRAYLYGLVDAVFAELAESKCIVLNEEAVAKLQALAASASRGAAGAASGGAGDAELVVPLASDAVASTTLGFIGSYYYLEHQSVRTFATSLAAAPATAPDLAWALCSAEEFSELPVRHNEDTLNEELASQLPWPVAPGVSFLSPHAKAFLLLQARLQHAPLPITDYVNDTKSVLDQSLRVLNAMVDIAADGGHLFTALGLQKLVQCVTMSLFDSDSTLWQLRGISGEAIAALQAAFKRAAGGAAASDQMELADLFPVADDRIRGALTSSGVANSAQIAALLQHLRSIPLIEVACKVGAAPAVPKPAATRPGELVVDVPAAVAIVPITVDLRIPNAIPKVAITPGFSRKKEWAWWIAIGTEADGQLHALKRVPLCVRGSASHTLQVAVSSAAAMGAAYTLYVISDTMRGIDKVIPLTFRPV